MNYIVAVACIALIVSEIPLISTTPELSPEQLAVLNRATTVCATKYHVLENTLTLLKDPSNIDAEDLPVIKCFVLCTLNERYIYEDGKVNMFEALRIYGSSGDESAHAAIKNCKNVIKGLEDDCESGYELHKCFEEINI